MALDRHIFDFSGALAEEGFRVPEASLHDFTSLEGANCYCSPEASSRLRYEISGIGAEGIHWIDTGDYHYMTLFFLEQFRGTVSLVLFDNHPDDQIPVFGPGILSCGSWVKDASALVRSLTAVGTGGSTDLSPLDSIPSGDIYVSIDKDVLSRESYRTDWDQGRLTPGELMDALGLLAARHRIAGLDICGGITCGKGGSDSDFALNLRTDLALKTFIDKLL